MYAFFDGDNIGATLEILLIENRISDAQRFSKSITGALIAIQEYLVQSGEKILILGGDDVLIEYQPDRFNMDSIEQIRTIFQQTTGNSMSCGLGYDVAESIRNLYLAKLYGKDKIKGGSNEASN